MEISSLARPSDVLERKMPGLDGSALRHNQERRAPCHTALALSKAARFPI
jgi:hypothetical protein